MRSNRSMNAKSYLISAVAFATAGFCYAGERVEQSQLPPAVQRAVTSSAVASGPVKEIHKESVDGKIVYEVEFEKDNAINPRVRFAEDGTIVDRGRFASVDNDATVTDRTKVTSTRPGLRPIDSESMLKLADLPANVRSTIEREAAGREIADLDLEVSGNRKFYEVEFREEGVNDKIHVAEDGTILKKEASDRGKHWFAGTQLEDTPAAVQATIRREVGNNRIADIDKERRTGRVVYEVEVDAASGKFQLHIAEDGTIVKDDRAKRVAE